MIDHLDPYRRHTPTCPDRERGRDFTLCACPIYVYGKLNGRPYRRSLQTDDWTRASRRIKLLLTSAGDTDAVLPVANARSIATAVKTYLAECATRNLQPSSITSYTRTLTQFTTYCGARSIGELNDVALIAGFRDSRKVKPRTQRKEIEFLRAFCAFCQTRDWIQRNPAKLIKPALVDDVATLPFTREESDKLIGACNLMRGMWTSDTPIVRQRARALIWVLLYSGLRVGDVAQLRRAQLEHTGHLVLRTEKNGVPVKVRLHPDAIQDLKGLPAPGGNPTYFFWSGHGDPADCAKSLWRTVARLGKVAGVHAHPHRFRDTFAVELLTGGADLRTVQKLLGHRSIRTTEKHYEHFVPEHQKRLDSATATLDFRPKPAAPLLVKPLQNRRREA